MAQWADVADSIYDRGHRESVGGLWHEIGRLQLDYLVRQGLRPHDILLDVACGSLRGGVHLIRYLERSHYLGIDKRIELIIYGVAAELGLDLFKEKRPRFVVSDCFDFDKFEMQPNFALGQSIFTHLSPRDIVLCLQKLRNHAAPECRFFATFSETDRPRENPPQSHSHRTFFYTRDQMLRFASEGGWAFDYIGDWGHPRNDRLAEFRPRLAV